MRAVRIDDLNMKILIERKMSQDTVVSGELVKVNSIDENMLILKDKVRQDTINDIREIKLFFQTGGKWKTYKLDLLEAVIEENIDIHKNVYGVKFKVNEDQEKDFLKDLSMCRY